MELKTITYNEIDFFLLTTNGNFTKSYHGFMFSDLSSPTAFGIIDNGVLYQDGEKIYSFLTGKYLEKKDLPPKPKTRKKTNAEEQFERKYGLEAKTHPALFAQFMRDREVKRAFKLSTD